MSSSLLTMSKKSKQQRRQALALLKSARSGRLSSALDLALHNNGDNGNNGNVYNMLDKDKYREYIERRREREDFVVDDGESVLVLAEFVGSCFGDQASNLNTPFVASCFATHVTLIALTDGLGYHNNGNYDILGAK